MEKKFCAEPVLFIIFNRPDLTRSVFEAIRQARPRRLYVSADGARKDKEDDAKKCRAVRDIALKQVDWDCDVFTNLREENLGCKLAVSSGIDWFFKNEASGIIIEDDTLPGLTFFKFCEELLEYYRNDKRVMMISGDNFQLGVKRSQYSYYFSRYTHVWGWATWRRGWEHYDVDMKSWPKDRDNGLLSGVLDSQREVSYWENIFEKVYKKEINTWDYQWLYACWRQGGCAILPDVNLVSNIGFGSGSTHLKRRDIQANLKSKTIEFPLAHPPSLVREKEADRFTDRLLFSSRPFYRKIMDRIILRKEPDEKSSDYRN